MRTCRGGVVKTPAFLEDYALFMQGLLALRRAALALDRPDERPLAAAKDLWREARTLFEDPARPGVLYDARPEQSELIVRTRSTHDGAMPSASSVMLHSLIDLYELTGERAYLADAAAVLAGLSRAIAESPVGSINATRGLLRLMRIDASLVDGIGGGGPDVVRLPDTPVKVFASAERVTVRAGEPAEVALEMRVEQGFHVTAREPGIEGLTPFSVEIRGGTGVRASVEYPRGEVYQGEALPAEDRGRMNVYSGLVRLTVRLERTREAWAGRPLLSVTYQACDDRACFQPITLELDVALDGE
jgi:hypothetical protein